ncbi:MAG: imidazole glycerol phosphate synthase subunit HisH [bacterium]
MIGLVDYGMGNLGSVSKAIREVGRDVQIIDQPGAINETEYLIVPGVGAFDRAVKNLREQSLWDPVLEHVRTNRPYLGICLGFQLLFEDSEEGERPGFGLYEGTVRKFQNVKPVPHMGWNDVDWAGPGSEFDPGENRPACYYFVHSYFVEPVNNDITAGVTEYGSDFCASIRDRNCVGVQFHPEKSQQAGLAFLRDVFQIWE